MLKVNVGLSKKLSRDYNSTGFSVNLEGEITAAANDSDAIIQQVKELFDLAEESLDQQVQRTQSISAQASHDAEPEHNPGTNGHSRNGQPSNGYAGNGHGMNGHNSRTPHDDRPSEPATNKQIQYLLSIGKRQRLSTVQLEHQVRDILRKQVGIYELTKKEAAKVIDTLTNSHHNGQREVRY